LAVRRVTLAGGLVAGLLLSCAHAHAQVLSEELRVTGLWPDVALAVGGGIGAGNSMASNALARARLGGLWAYEPFVLNLGVSGEVGGLGGLGAGLELEVNHFGGGFLRGGLLRVRGGDTMSQLALGFTVLGLEWHHRFDSPRSDAVLFTVRLPIGIWWFLLAREPSGVDPPARHPVASDTQHR
jgi:hypothetical protein